MMKRYQVVLQLKEVTLDSAGQQVNKITSSATVEFQVSEQSLAEVPIYMMQGFRESVRRIEQDFKWRLNARYEKLATPVPTDWHAAMLAISNFDAEINCEHDPVDFDGGVKCRNCYGWIKRP